jgi:hypothetical protein
MAVRTVTYAAPPWAKRMVRTTSAMLLERATASRRSSSVHDLGRAIGLCSSAPGLCHDASTAVPRRVGAPGIVEPKTGRRV